MSVTQCRSCDQPINFVALPNGRWRPVDVRYYSLELAGNEIAASQRTGTWEQFDGTNFRIYTLHQCRAEDPSWDMGRPPMDAADELTLGETSFDPSTGEVREEAPTLAKAKALRASVREARTRTRRYGAALQVECPLCRAGKDQPCVDVEAWTWKPIEAPHKVRVHASHFSGQDDGVPGPVRELGQPWPPARNQRGYRAMRSWLGEHSSIFADLA